MSSSYCATCSVQLSADACTNAHSEKATVNQSPHGTDKLRWRGLQMRWLTLENEI